MKKILFSLLGIACCAAVWAGNDKRIAFTELPESARTTVTRHFDAAQVATVKQDREWFGTTYEVTFYDGTEIEFLGNGEWKEIDCSPRAVPAGLIPAEIARLVQSRYPGRSIVKIDRDRRDWEVELDDETELKFDLKFNLIEVDR